MPDDLEDAAEQDLATLFAALRAPAEPHELAREGEYLAAFAAAQALRSDPPDRRRTSVLTSLLATKTATRVAAAAAAVAAAAATGAYTGTLPDRLQNVAHDTIGAPAGDVRAQRPGTAPKADPTTSPRASHRVDATDAAAHGLCTAFAAGGLATTSTAYRSLAEAAGGPAGIPAFCATVDEPGRPSDKPSVQPTGNPSAHPTGKPSDVGTGKPDGKSTGKPTDLRTGKPTDAPGR
jgi:hypothetical protein